MVAQPPGLSLTPPSFVSVDGETETLSNQGSVKNEDTSHDLRGNLSQGCTSHKGKKEPTKCHLDLLCLFLFTASSDSAQEGLVLTAFQAAENCCYSPLDVR